jgi:spermidine synthase
VTEVTLDHEFLMSSYLTASEKALANIALEMHLGSDLEVLVGGLGLGYTAHAALGSPRVAHCDVVEFLPQVIDWLRTGLVPLSEELNREPRLHVIHADVYKRLTNRPEKQYDLILIDVDHSPAENLGAANGYFYTASGLEAAKKHLTIGGMLGVWSYAPDSPFADALREVFDEVRVEPITVLNNLIDVEQTDWLFFARDR